MREAIVVLRAAVLHWRRLFSRTPARAVLFLALVLLLGGSAWALFAETRATLTGALATLPSAERAIAVQSWMQGAVGPLVAALFLWLSGRVPWTAPVSLRARSLRPWLVDVAWHAPLLVLWGVGCACLCFGIAFALAPALGWVAVQGARFGTALALGACSLVAAAHCAAHATRAANRVLGAIGRGWKGASITALACNLGIGIAIALGARPTLVDLILPSPEAMRFAAGGSLRSASMIVLVAAPWLTLALVARVRFVPAEPSWTRSSRGRAKRFRPNPPRSLVRSLGMRMWWRERQGFASALLSSLGVGVVLCAALWVADRASRSTDGLGRGVFAMIVPICGLGAALFGGHFHRTPAQMRATSVSIADWTLGQHAAALSTAFGLWCVHAALIGLILDPRELQGALGPSLAVLALTTSIAFAVGDAIPPDFRRRGGDSATGLVGICSVLACSLFLAALPVEVAPAGFRELLRSGFALLVCLGALWWVQRGRLRHGLLRD